MIPNERKLYESRIETFIKRLQSLFYGDKIDLDIHYCKFDPHVPFEKRLDGEYLPAERNMRWGKNWERVWFHLTGRVPQEWEGRNVVARINLGGESLVFSSEGLPIEGLSVHTIWPQNEFWRDRVQITTESKGTEKVDLWVEGSAGQLWGVKLEEDQGDHIPKQFGYHAAEIQYVELAIFQKAIWDLYLDFNVLNDLMHSLPEKTVRRKRILRVLNAAIDQFMGDDATTEKARKIVKAELNKSSSQSDLQTLAVGHAHIDTAWLWPIHETIRKCARTFSSQIALIEKYPDYCFGASQAQHYAFIKEYYPSLYSKIRDNIQSGRWEVQGGMWIEADCNIISGESMVRQILHGKNFFKNEFNVDVRNLWLPDVFGYSAAMPQILQKSGIEFFITQKLSWSQFNQFPHRTFLWRGIDGTEVITHFPPEDNYNSDLSPAALIKARENFEENDRLDEFLTLFGIGDGGCGPTEEIIETGIRQKNMEGAPRVQFGHAQDMLDRLIEHKGDLPRWVGELYLEIHRGTLTTQAYNKKMNRYMELKLRQLECLYSLLPYSDYPGEQLDEMWKTLLINQFHDIIPGSSITPVYEQTSSEYETLSKQAEQLEKTAGEIMFESNNEKLTLINTLSVGYNRPIELTENWAGYKILDEENQTIPVQIEKGKPFVSCRIAPLGIITLTKGKKTLSDKIEPANNDFVLENDLIRYEFNDQGVITRILDKEDHKEVLTEKGSGNLLSLYEDRPVNWDAWDIDIFYEKQMLKNPELEKRRWIADGPVRQGISHDLVIGNSKIHQNIYLASDSKRIDFETEVDWNENHKMLRVSFEVSIISETATFEIQYGNVQRNTHRNTSWDMAKFEVAGHRYADLSDRNYGVALLNNCKYGYKIYDNIIDLNLLRSTTNPDPTADRGKHQFIYSLLPHSNEMIASDVIAEAQQLNQPPRCYVGKDRQKLTIPISLDSDDVILEVIKKAEKENATILRLYEPRGKYAEVTLNLDLKSFQIYDADLMENELEELTHSNGKVPLRFKPFEIKTLKLIRN